MEGAPTQPDVPGIWVGNLSFSTGSAALVEFFKPCGTVTRINLPKDHKDPTKNKGFAYIDFKEAGAMEKARGLSESLLDGRRVLIKGSKDFRKDKGKAAAATTASGDDSTATTEPTTTSAPKSPSPTVFIGNLSFSCTPVILENAMKGFGEIRKVRLATFEDTGRCKGYVMLSFFLQHANEQRKLFFSLSFGYVDSKSVESATKAVTARQLRIDGRQVRAEYASEEATRRGGVSKGSIKRAAATTPAPKKEAKAAPVAPEPVKRRLPKPRTPQEPQAPAEPLSSYAGKKVTFDDDDD